MNQFPNIPNSVKEDIRKRAEERYPYAERAVSHGLANGIALRSREAYTLALCEAWEIIDRAYTEGYKNGEVDKRLDLEDMSNEGKTEFLNQIFKR